MNKSPGRRAASTSYPVVRRLGLAIVATVVWLLLMAAVSASAASTAGDLASAGTPFATLESSSETPGIQFPAPIATSAGTVVAGGAIQPPGASVDVFTEPTGGWVSGTQAAQLVPAGVSSPAGYFGSSVAISGDTVAVDDYLASPASRTDYVFTKPPRGWSGTLAPSATLSPPAGFAPTGSIAVSGADVFESATAQTGGATTRSAFVFAPPAGGWSGNVSPVARLVGAQPPLAVSGNTVFAGSQPVQVYTEPANGWTNAIMPSAKLITGQQLSLTNDIVLTASDTTAVLGAQAQLGPYVSGTAFVFSEPKRGWTGTIRRVARLGALGFESGGSFDPDMYGSTLVISGDRIVVTDSEYLLYQSTKACPCQSAVFVFSRPPGGWTGDVASAPVFSVDTPPEPSAGLLGSDLFIGTAPLSAGESGPGVVSVVRLETPPSVSQINYSGLAVGHPALRLRIGSGTGGDTVGSITLTLPPGLRFSSNLKRIRRAAAIKGARLRLGLHHGLLTMSVTRPSHTISLTIHSAGLTESAYLRRARHALRLTTRIAITKASGRKMRITEMTAA
jgi:hypothetical protein